MRRRFTSLLLLASCLGALVACTKPEDAPTRPNGAAGGTGAAPAEREHPDATVARDSPAAPLAAATDTPAPAAGQDPDPAAPPAAAVAGIDDPGAALSTPGSTTPATARALPVEAAATTNATAPAPDGAALFASTCATCHMADGSGVPFLQPSIKGSAWIASPDPQLLLSLILRGSAVLGEAAQAYDNDMAPQEHLTDAEIAAVATYVRTRFAAPPIEKPVSPAEVAIARARPGLPQ